MSSYTDKQQKTHKRYNKKVISKSMFDGNPTLIINTYRTPSAYRKAVVDVITAYKHGIPFNRAVDQVYALDPNHINRNKLAEHTLKYIANEY